MRYTIHVFAYLLTYLVISKYSGED